MIMCQCGNWFPTVVFFWPEAILWPAATSVASAAPEATECFGRERSHYIADINSNERKTRRARQRINPDKILVELHACHHQSVADFKCK